jgi:serine phosphatase RsbU (regulator of sigma subunit)
MLLSAVAGSRPEQLPALVAQAARALGAADAVMYVIDYDQLVLCPLLDKPGQPAAAGEPVAVEGTLAGRAYATGVPQQTHRDSQTVLWFPLLDGAQRLGVVELVFTQLGEIGEELQAECAHLVRLVGELSSTRSLYGDAVEASRRRLPMSTATELQRLLLPPLTFASRELVIAGALVPSYSVAGDCYDYAVNGDTAHIAIFDAMGHAMEATVLAAVAISAYRNARRTGLDLVDTAISMDRWMTNQFGEEKFLTAILGQLDIGNGEWRWITCGHPPALLLRDGRVVKTLEQVISPPIGLLAGAELEPAVERLQPGDRLVLHSDGVTEARAADGQFFGLDGLADYVTRYAFDALPAPETLRRLIHAVLAHQDGQLTDDATVVLIEWHGQQAAETGELPTVPRPADRQLRS